MAFPNVLTPLGIEYGAVYTIIGPHGDFAIGPSRAVINDPADPDHVGFISGDGDGVTGLEGAGVRENSDTLPEARGGVHGIFLRDRLPFTLKGTIDLGLEAAGSTRQDKLIRATDALDEDAWLEWYPSTYPDGVRAKFRTQQPTRITGRRPRSFLVAGVVESGVIESRNMRAVWIIPSASSAGGFGSPLSSPLRSVITGGTSADLFNAGRSEAWPIITVYGPCTNPVVINDNTGEAIYLTYALAADEFLILDTDPRRRTLLLNNQADRYYALDFGRSTWWPVRPGSNPARVGFASFGVGAQVSIHYYDTW